jgi:copper chaperone
MIPVEECVMTRFGTWLVVGWVVVIGLGVAACKGEAAGQQITFAVQGMTCGSCEMAIKGKLVEMDGVSLASAAHGPGEVTATYDPEVVTPEELAAAITALGYTVDGWEIGGQPAAG